MKINEITHIEALKDYVIIYTIKQKLITAMNLKTFHSKLPSNTYYRVSKSFIVNKNFITSFDYNSIYIDEIVIPLGSIYRKDFFHNFGEGSLDLNN